MPPDVARKHPMGAVVLAVAGAQDAESTRPYRLERLSALTAPQAILAITQKRKMPIFHPFEEGTGLAEFGRVEPVGRRTQILRGSPRGTLHARPIRACHAHIPHAALDLRRQRFNRRGVDDAVHFDVLKRFQALVFVLRRAAPLNRLQGTAALASYGKYRVRQEMQRKRAFSQCETDRVDEEWHIIVDYIDNGMR